MFSDPKYSLSVHPGVLDKPDEATRRQLGRGWTLLEVSEDEIANFVRAGRPLAPQYRGGNRKTVNFVCAGFLAADVDRGMTLDEARNHLFVLHHASLIHTTVSHTAEHHRFRIIFLLHEPILNATDWADAQLGIALKMTSDATVTDGARLFFGASNATVFRIGRTIPPAIVADLIARGRDAQASRRPRGILPVVSVRRIAGPELVKVAGGGHIRFDELTHCTRVHCPHHEDDDPSAFAVSSRFGQIGIYCSSCRVTFWSGHEQDGYDFYAFDRLSEEPAADQSRIIEDAVSLDRFYPPAPRFERLQQPFLPPFGYEPGITLVKSPKGSGKTEALRFLLQQIRAAQIRRDIAPKDWPKSVLLVSHRQSLSREFAAKLGLRCYLDAENDPEGPLRTLVVTLDSLPKYNESTGKSARKAFDLIIIDESEQVFGHLFGDTIKKGRGLQRCFDALHFEIAHAKAVVALDADLGLVTTDALRTMRSQDWASRCRIICNAPVPPAQKRTIRLHKSRSFLEQEVVDAIKRGERCFIVSNSKRFIDRAHRMILNECGDGIVMRAITRDNSRDESTVQFLANIKTEFLRVQVVLGTPSIGTGIDITFPDGQVLVDRVFGFFYPFVNTHTDIDQQLSRVRHPGAIDVWVSPGTFNFTSNVEVIKDDLARAYVVPRAVKGRPRPDGLVEYDRDDPLLNLCAHVTALQRASKNRLVDLFCALREANGWTVEWVAGTASASPMTVAKEMLEAERAEMLLAAPSVDDADYIELDEKVSKGANLTKEERIVHERNHFERTVGVRLDEFLIEMNTDGRLIDKVKTLAGVLPLLSVNDRGDDLVSVLLDPTDTRRDVFRRGNLNSSLPS
ncbi:plasmid replication protein, CyRepA1 family [Bradyrhizobium sp. TZ2]